MREQNIQNAIRIALSDHGMVFRTNAGTFWQGKQVYDQDRKQRILTNLRPVSGLPEGFPDLVFFGKDGKTVFIETKRPGEKPKPEQENFINLARSYGFAAGVARSVDDAMRLIE